MRKNKEERAALQWGAYLRISDDPHDTQRGVNRQREDAAAAVAARGGDPAAIRWYVENDTSAYKKRRVQVTDPTGRIYYGFRVIRPVWHEALDDLRSNRVGALVVWDLDRLARDPRDLEDAIEAVEHYGARVHSATAADVDLSTDTGRLTARLAVMIAQKSSADTSRRVRRAHLESARNGDPVGGTRPFGWLDDKVTLHAAEAAAIQAAATDVLAGVAVKRIADRWNAAGLTTSKGGEWSGNQVLRLLRSPRLAGWRIHRPAGTPWTAVPPIAVDANGAPVRGRWTPVLDDATWRALVARLTAAPERRSRVPRRNARHYLLTGLLRCAVCNGPMYGNRVGTGHYYRCDAGHKPGNSVSGRGVDAAVGAALVEYSEVIEAQPLGGATPADERIARLSNEIADHDALIDDIMAGFRERKVSAATAFRTVADLERTRDALIHERDTAAAAATAQRGEPVTAEAWAALAADTDRRRALLEGRLTAVYCRPPSGGHSNRFDAERLDYVWKA